MAPRFVVGPTPVNSSAKPADSFAKTARRRNWSQRVSEDVAESYSLPNARLGAPSFGMDKFELRSASLATRSVGACAWLPALGSISLERKPTPARAAGPSGWVARSRRARPGGWPRRLADRAADLQGGVRARRCALCRHRVRGPPPRRTDDHRRGHARPPGEEGRQ